MRASIGVLMSLTALVGGFAAGCGDQTFEPASRGRRGESCTSRNECQGGLACLGGVCGTENFDISAESASCKAIFCEIADDCCDLVPGICDFQAFDCVDNACVPEEVACKTDVDCDFDEFCVAGNCVECRTNDDCFGEDVACVAGECFVPECETDADCAVDEGGVFDVCRSGECVFIGCESDRQCKAAFNSPLSECRDPGDGSPPACIQPCETDGECTFFGRFEGCVQGICQYLGCETDAECTAQCVSQPATCENFFFGAPAPLSFRCVP